MLFLVIIPIIVLILFLPLPIKSKTYVNVNTQMLCENLDISLFPTAVFTLALDASKGIKADVNPKKHSSGKASKAIKNKLLTSLDSGGMIKLPLKILGKLHLKSIKVVGEIGLNEAFATSFCVGILHSVYCFIMANNSGLCKKSTFFLHENHDKFVMDMSISLSFYITPFIILCAFLDILKANKFGAKIKKNE